jgi:hypothetical protein
MKKRDDEGGDINMALLKSDALGWGAAGKWFPKGIEHNGAE